jgi:hypothetical protein
VPAGVAATQIVSDSGLRPSYTSVRPTYNFHYTLYLSEIPNMMLRNSSHSDRTVGLHDPHAVSKGCRRLAGHGLNSECSLFPVGQYQTTMLIGHIAN